MKRSGHGVPAGALAGREVRRQDDRREAVLHLRQQLRHHQPGSSAIRIDPKKDKKGPLTLAAAGTYNAAAAAGPLRGGRAAPRWVVEQHSSRFNGNRDLFLNMVNWLSSDEDLISIRPKEPEDRQLNITGPTDVACCSGSSVVVPAAGRGRRRPGHLVAQEVAAMKFRGLLIAVALLAVLGGLRLVVEQEAEGRGRPRPPADAAAKMLTIPEDQIREIRDREDRRRDHRAAQGRRRQVGDRRAEAAARGPGGGQLDGLHARLAERRQAGRGEGRGPGRLRPRHARARRDDHQEGRQDREPADRRRQCPPARGAYAKLASDPRVFTIASYTKTSLDKTANDLRDKRLLTFDSEKLTRVELAGQGPGRRVRQEQPERVADPQAARRCAPTARRWRNSIRKLKDAKMDTAVIRRGREEGRRGVRLRRQAWRWSR